MKTFSLLRSICLGLFLFNFVFLHVFAGPGDTLMVDGPKFEYTWYSNHYDWAVFPDESMSYQKVNLYLTVSCLNGNCSDYDYSTDFYLRHYTGETDSNEVNVPDFTVDGGVIEEYCYQVDTTFTYYFHPNTESLDSFPNTAQLVYFYDDPADAYAITDSMLVFPGNYFNPTFDSLGNVNDSVWVGYDSCLTLTYTTLFVPFEVYEEHQLAGFITPFGNQFDGNWNFTWTYDITDFQPLLHDSVEFRGFYGGWASGWKFDYKFELVEGTPPRNTLGIHPLWTGDFPYGNVSNPIENYLTPKTFLPPSGTQQAEVRMAITGHSFGGDPCAEFCQKIHELEVNQSSSYDVHFWRNDCDLNPLYPQGGTWLYDRGGWCPGSEVRATVVDVSSHLLDSDSLTVDLNAASYVYNGGNNFPPSYRIGSQIIMYGEPNFTLDAEVYKIISPSNDDMMGRVNPTCAKAKIVIRNGGNTPLTSLKITYGVEGAAMSTYDWSGNLGFLVTEEVELEVPEWGTIQPNDNLFSVTVSEPNMGSDENMYNNTMKASFDQVPELISPFAIKFKTNNAANETKYFVMDDQGNVLHQSQSFLQPNTSYWDTLNLAPGCYMFRMTDSGGDGLDFFNNNDGSGHFRLFDGTTGDFLFEIENDFGGEQYYIFTVDTLVGLKNTLSSELVDVYPNPSNGQFVVDLRFNQGKETTLEVYTLLGTKIYSEHLGLVKHTSKAIDLGKQPSGMYLVHVHTPSGTITERLLISKKN